MNKDTLKAALIARVMPHLNLTMYQRAKIAEIALKMEDQNTNNQKDNETLYSELRAIREAEAKEEPEEPEQIHRYGERNPHAQPTEEAVRAWLEEARRKYELRVEGLKPTKINPQKELILH